MSDQRFLFGLFRARPVVDEVARTAANTAAAACRALQARLDAIEAAPAEDWAGEIGSLSERLVGIEGRLHRLETDGQDAAQSARAQIRALLEAGDRQLATGRDLLGRLEAEARDAEAAAERRRQEALDRSRDALAATEMRLHQAEAAMESVRARLVEEVASGRAQLDELTATARRHVIAARADNAARAEQAREPDHAPDPVRVAAPEPEPAPDPGRVSPAQAEAVNAAYWQLETLGERLGRVRAALAAETGPQASPALMQSVRAGLVLENEELGDRIELLGADIALGFDTLAHALHGLQHAEADRDQLGAALADLEATLRPLVEAIERLSLGDDEAARASFGEAQWGRF